MDGSAFDQNFLFNCFGDTDSSGSIKENLYRFHGIFQGHFDNCSSNAWLDNVNLLYSIRDFALPVIFLFCGFLLFIPIILVIYVYLHWPVVLIYDLIFTCLQKFGYFKGVDRWDIFMTGVCRMWKPISSIWHGYETIGMENVPKDSPAIFVFYHGPISVDIYYFVKSFKLKNGKLCRAVFHRQLTRLPGWPLMKKIARGLCGTRENCLKALKEGDHIVIAPGGDREPLLSDETNYKLVWMNRTGFAKVAIEAQVPLIPVFTENIQELFRAPRILRTVFLFIDKYLQIPLVPAYGGFPVKLRSHIGKPIYPEPNQTPEELAEKTRVTLQHMIYKHQRIPGSIYAAIAQRF